MATISLRRAAAISVVVVALIMLGWLWMTQPPLRYGATRSESASVFEYAGPIAAASQFPTDRAPAKPVPDKPMELVETARRDLRSQEQRAGELLAWLEHLRRNPSAVTQEDRVVVYHVLMLLAELRYEPAIPFLVAEEVDPQVGWRDPIQEGPLLEAGPLRSVFKRDPSLAALIKIGSPAVTALLNKYIRDVWTWRDKDKRDRLLGRWESVLVRPELLGEALDDVQWRLLRASSTPGDREEIDALHHLKRKLLKRFD